MSAVEDVRDQILALLAETHAAGEVKLPSERALATRFSVSRSTVREALRGLADQGGIVANHGSAWVVQTGTKQLVQALGLQLQFGELTHDQLLESRLVIEPPVASLAAQRRSIEDLAELQRLYLFMSEAETDAEFLRYDIAFHEQLARCTGNGYFVLAVTPLLLTLSETRQESLVVQSRRPMVLDEHRTILDAIHARDPAAAGSAMREHIGSFARSVGLAIPMDTVAPRRRSAGNSTARPRKTAAAQRQPKESDG